MFVFQSCVFMSCFSVFLSYSLFLSLAYLCSLLYLSLPCFIISLVAQICPIIAKQNIESLGLLHTLLSLGCICAVFCICSYPASLYL